VVLPETNEPIRVSDTLPKVDGFDNTKKNQPSPTSRLGPGGVPPVDPVPDAGMAKPGGGERQVHKRFSQPLSEPERALAKDAQEQARQLKREHKAIYTADPRRFRKIVRLAQSAVFRHKPGPKPDRKAARRIAHAARRRARGTKWEELYQRFIPDYGKLNPVTRSDADDGFRRKVTNPLPLLANSPADGFSGHAEFIL
jgi:hypothetical protein